MIEERPRIHPGQSPTFESAAETQAAEMEKLEAVCRSGGNWFYGIAGLSLVNSAILLMGSEWGFIIGLGTTQVVDAVMLAVAESAGNVAKFVAFGMDVTIAGIVALFGFLAGKRLGWAFVVGMILYALDGLLFVLVGDWLSLGFHVFVLFNLWNGCRACFKLNRMAAQPAGFNTPTPIG